VVRVWLLAPDGGAVRKQFVPGSFVEIECKFLILKLNKSDFFAACLMWLDRSIFLQIA
jgi:hypothetical protein